MPRSRRNPIEEYERAAAPAIAEMDRLITEWQAMRIVLRELEEAEHAPITDRLGRVWTWWKGDLYRHDSMATPECFLNDPRYPPQWPCASLWDNPNYRWCDYCRAHRAEYSAC
jgi:hypothetical protein